MEQTLEKKPETKKQTEETPLEFIASICGVFVLGLFALTFIFQNFEIPSSSMEKTLLIGDHVVVDRSTLAPPTKWAPFVHYRDIQRGDIIVFYKPVTEPGTDPNSEHLFLVKRVIGIPGDHIHLRHGIVYLNGKPQNEPQAAVATDENYLPYVEDFPSVSPSTTTDVTAEWAVDLPSHIQGDDLVVPPGHYFAMGDNRPVSLDSRYWGFVPRENIIGRPLFVYWSFVTPEDQMNKTSIGDRVGFIFHIIFHFFTETRWSRTLHIVK